MINLSIEVLKRMDNIGAIDDDKLTTVAIYYFNDAFDKMFGKHEFDESEIDLTFQKGILEIRTVFDDALYRVVNSSNASIVCFKDNDKVFEVEKNEDVIKSDFIKDNMIEEKEVSVHSDSKFTLTKTENNEISFKCTIVPINAKYKDQELFLKEQIFPQKEHETSFLKNLYNKLSDDSIVSVKTDDSIESILYYPDAVFKKLEEEAEKIQEKSK